MAPTKHLNEKLQQMDAERRVYAIALLPIHLADAQLYDRLYSLLTDFQFMSAKVALLGVHPLIDDYGLCPNDMPEVQLLKQALQLSAHNVNRDRIQLASQLLGRLLTSPSFCTTASERVYITTSSGKDANGGSQGAVGDRRAAICGANAAGAL